MPNRPNPLGNLAPYVNELASSHFLKLDIASIARASGLSEGVVRNFVKDRGVSTQAKAAILTACGVDREAEAIPTKAKTKAEPTATKLEILSIPVLDAEASPEGDDPEDEELDPEARRRIEQRHRLRAMERGPSRPRCRNTFAADEKTNRIVRPKAITPGTAIYDSEADLHHTAPIFQDLVGLEDQ